MVSSVDSGRSRFPDRNNAAALLSRGNRLIGDCNFCGCDRVQIWLDYLGLTLEDLFGWIWRVKRRY